jgi:hypothetical protein
MTSKLIYIAHPIGGNVLGNIGRVLKIVRDISLLESDTIPFAPYIVDLLALDDDNPEEREIGMRHNEQVLRSGIVAEVWLFGPKISRGMEAEIRLADDLKIPVYAQTIETQRDLQSLRVIINI